jgi:predicted Zn-dependent protease with MMP-like domain
MIKSDKQSKSAKETVSNLEVILERARKVHTPSEYRAMSEPILIELQQRESDILQYLSITEPG